MRKLQLARVEIAEVERPHRNGGPEYGNSINHWYEDYDRGQRQPSWADPAMDTSRWKAVPIPGSFK